MLLINKKYMKIHLIFIKLIKTKKDKRVFKD